MTYTWNDIENALIEDICETYGSEDMYIEDYFDVKAIKENIKSMPLNEFVEWFRNTYEYEIWDIIAEYFNNFASDWDGEYTLKELAEFIYNNLH